MLATIFGALLLCGVAAATPQSAPSVTSQWAQSAAPSPVVASPAVANPPADQVNSDEQVSGVISGTILDQSGAVVSGATVSLTRESQSAPQETTSDQNGRFFFSNVAAGPFQVTVTLPGFATQTASGVLASNDTYFVPPISLSLATFVTQVQVMPQEQVAEGQIKEQEKQRLIGVVPNFYVSYIPDAAPLDAKQKFELAWKTTIDPMTLVLTAGTAGVQQWDNEFSGYGHGARAYPKYLGAAYGNVVGGTFIGSAILPSLFKQDPRYFYKGTGGTRFRLLYALANAFICKGDDRRWQPNYSNILGSIAAGGLSNAYYPEQNRNGAALTFENALIGIGATAAGNIFEEFFSRRFTPSLPSDDSDKRSRNAGKLSNSLTSEGL